MVFYLKIKLGASFAEKIIIKNGTHRGFNFF